MTGEAVTDGVGAGGVTAVPVRAVTALAWAGLVLHNALELPGWSALGPDTIGPGAAWVVVAVLWSAPRTARGGAWLALGWGALGLAGATLSVLPLRALPFDPPQTPSHYAVHALYAATHLPVLAVSAGCLRRDARRV